MRKTLAKFRSAVSLLAALAILSTSTAYAALPGEGGTYYEENVGASNNPTAVLTPNMYSEARDPNNQYLLRAWRGPDGQVVMSFRGGVPFTLGYSQTAYAPSVAYYGDSRFVVAQTGTDRQIYYSVVNGTNATGTNWQAVPGQQAVGPVSLAAVNAGSYFIFMTFLGTDTRVLGEYLDNGSWNFTGQIATGVSGVPPSVAFNPSNQVLWAAIAVGGIVWVSWQYYGSSSWSSWISLGGNNIVDTPYITALPNGNMVMSAVAANGNPYFREFNASMSPITGDWSQDITGDQTANPVFLTIAGGIAYALLVGYNNVGYWKPVANR